MWRAQYRPTRSTVAYSVPPAEDAAADAVLCDAGALCASKLVGVVVHAKGAATLERQRGFDAVSSVDSAPLVFCRGALAPTMFSSWPRLLL